MTFRRSRTDEGWELPKTPSGGRTVDIDEQTAAALRRWRKRQNELRLAAGPAWRDTIVIRGRAVPNELVFTQLDGRSGHPSPVTRRFQELRLRAGLPYIVLHDLRHTHATLLLKAGFNPKIVQERLGHKSVAITLDLYGQVLPSMGRDVAAHVDRMLTADPGAEVKPLVRLEAARGSNHGTGICRTNLRSILVLPQ